MSQSCGEQLCHILQRSLGVSERKFGIKPNVHRNATVTYGYCYPYKAMWLAMVQLIVCQNPCEEDTWTSTWGRILIITILLCGTTIFNPFGGGAPGFTSESIRNLNLQDNKTFQEQNMLDDSTWFSQTKKDFSYRLAPGTGQSRTYLEANLKLRNGAMLPADGIIKALNCAQETKACKVSSFWEYQGGGPSRINIFRWNNSETTYETTYETTWNNMKRNDQSCGQLISRCRSEVAGNWGDGPGGNLCLKHREFRTHWLPETAEFFSLTHCSKTLGMVGDFFHPKASC